MVHEHVNFSSAMTNEGIISCPCGNFSNKHKKLFTVKSNNKQINMEVNESNYNHFQSLSPMQQKAVQDLMTLKFLQEMND